VKVKKMTTTTTTKKWMMTAVAEFDFEVFAETPEDAEEICLENLDNGLFVAESGKEYTAFYNSTKLVNDPKEMEISNPSYETYAKFREHRGEGDTTAVEKLLRKVDELEKELEIRWGNVRSGVVKANNSINNYLYSKDGEEGA